MLLAERFKLLLEHEDEDIPHAASEPSHRALPTHQELSGQILVKG
jgi:hypothetical protein